MPTSPRHRAAAATAWAVPRLWLLGTAAAVGLPAGGVGAVVFGPLVGGSLLAGMETVFALGALVCGFGTLGWSGSVMAGRGFEELQSALDTGTDWTEADSRRAMTRIAGFGAGLMLSAPILAAVV